MEFLVLLAQVLLLSFALVFLGIGLCIGFTVPVRIVKRLLRIVLLSIAMFFGLLSIFFKIAAAYLYVPRR